MLNPALISGISLAVLAPMLGKAGKGLAKVATNKYFIVAVVVVAVVLFVYFYGRNTGEDSVADEYDKLTEDLPNAGSEIPSSWSPDSLANELYNAFNYSVLAGDINLRLQSLKKLLALSDDQIVAVWNKYNTDYLVGKGKTFTDEVDRHWFNRWDDTDTNALRKFESLGLKKYDDA